MSKIPTARDLATSQALASSDAKLQNLLDEVVREHLEHHADVMRWCWSNVCRTAVDYGAWPIP